MKANSTLNHSAAHLLAAAILKLYPGTKIGIGPSIEEGFYYDFLFKEPISDADLPKIEKQMKQLVAGGYKFIKDNEINEKVLSDQPFKQELLKEIKERGEKASSYSLVNPSNNEVLFSDLCAGPHLESVGKIKFFKLMSIAGAYWRGDSKNQQLTRIYGTAWETQDELNSYLSLVAERKERDHRKIGKDMNLFMFSQLSGQGFPMYLEDGMIIKNEIQSYVRETEKRYGFREVQTPAFGEKQLYVTSGHWAHYKDNMYQPVKVENEELVMRPMTCPHHFIIYNSKPRSYRELPIRMSEQARLYRYEKSGALTGLERVRSMELTEGHIFCRPDQIIDEFKNAYKLIKEVIAKFDIEIGYVSLSLRDPLDKEKYHNDDKMWNDAESGLRKVLKELNVEYKEMIGEAAFYGPKIDIQVKTVLGHDITLSTIQLDFLLPKRFEAYYIDKDGSKQAPVLIHRGLIGTYERFIATLLEQTKGVLPFWLAPRQATIIPVNENIHTDYAYEIKKELEEANIRVVVDDSNERVGKKIRSAQISKTKFQLVVGDEEVKNKNINVRAYGSEDTKEMSVEEFIKMVKK